MLPCLITASLINCYVVFAFMTTNETFYNYESYLDVSKQKAFLPQTEELKTGLCECFEWYRENQDKVNKKPYFEFIDENLIK